MLWHLTCFHLVLQTGLSCNNKLASLKILGLHSALEHCCIFSLQPPFSVKLRPRNTGLNIFKETYRNTSVLRINFSKPVTFCLYNDLYLIIRLLENLPNIPAGRYFTTLNFFRTMNYVLKQIRQTNFRRKSPKVFKNGTTTGIETLKLFLSFAAFILSKLSPNSFYSSFPAALSTSSAPMYIICTLIVISPVYDILQGKRVIFQLDNLKLFGFPMNSSFKKV